MVEQSNEQKARKLFDELIDEGIKRYLFFDDSLVMLPGRTRTKEEFDELRDIFKPGGTIRKLSPEDRELLKHLTSDMARGYRGPWV